MFNHLEVFLGGMSSAARCSSSMSLCVHVLTCDASSNKCHASSNRCLTSSNKKLLETIS